MAVFVWITAKRKCSDKNLNANTVFESYRKGYREVEKRDREEEPPIKGADQVGYHRSSWSSVLWGWASQDRTHTSVIPPRGRELVHWYTSWRVQSLLESCSTWSWCPSTSSLWARPEARESSTWKQLRCWKLETQCERQDGEGDRIQTGQGPHVLQQPHTVHHSNQGNQRVKGSTISNHSGKQARFRMTWANYHAWACICSCDFCIKLIWLYGVPSTWSCSVLITEPSKVLKIKEMLRKHCTAGPRMRWPFRVGCYSNGIGFKVRQPRVETQTPLIHC